AAQILALHDDELAGKLADRRDKTARQVLEAEEWS
ncbi:MAG: hypothetical protein FD166_3682, partial [Bacteroidetes bacterium]